MFRCPFCYKTTATFYGLVIHVETHIKYGRCPVCDEEVRNIKHHVRAKARQGGRGHKVLYGLLVRARSYCIGDFKKECRDLAYKACEVRSDGYTSS